MTALFANTDRKSRISGNFPSYRRNDGYDNKVSERKVQQTVSAGRSESVDAVAGREAKAEAHIGAVVWRRSRTTDAPSVLSPSLLALVVGKFIWSVLMRVFRRLQPISIVLFLALVTFLIGFVAFSEKVNSMQSPVLGEPADAIVVLTGGQSRIQAALDLLKGKQGKRLLISGVHPSTTEKSLQRATHTEQSLFDCCVDLDRSALNTVGNATESERWIRANNYHRVIVVTNNYHIPRSILEMSYRMQDVEFVPYPVVNGEKRAHSWVAEGDTLRVLFIEYVKYLGAALRVGGAKIFGSTFESS
ncbi:YdcF family protein [Ochrobactrum quorumnocens]|uniref:YdcF family protein n=1 Tax=Ochrobactrum quorumnocens TaxID=271865 RepID=A0A5N1K1D8_9HYPH|nr:YdcF family protein [[Ochrobactrum] quorumnocens]KAA9369178.1 YdcF family protein [[Ochrobactrum] quorumnocens]